MKTWEMIKELTENPEKKFKEKSFGQVEMFKGYLVQSSNMDIIVINKDILEKEWEEVKEPVTWKEAFEAGLNGKKIKPKGQFLTYNNFESIDYAIAYLAARPGYYKKIMLDDWYIED